jgi:hypothetical protein
VEGWRGIGGGSLVVASVLPSLLSQWQMLSTTALQPAVEADIYFSNLFWFEIAVLMSKAGNNINGDDISSLMSVFETSCRNMP